MEEIITEDDKDITSSKEEESMIGTLFGAKIITVVFTNTDTYKTGPSALPLYYADMSADVRSFFHQSADTEDTLRTP